PISDEGDWLPTAHKNYTPVEGLSESLQEALRCFLLATAIRDLRAARGVDGGGGGIHRSMLVNVSRFTMVQNQVAAALDVALDEMRRAVRLYGSLSPARAEASSAYIATLAQSFATEFGECGFTWTEVLGVLHTAISPIVVQPVNQSK